MNQNYHWYGFALLLLFLIGCASTKQTSKATKPQLLNEDAFKITQKSKDKTYGFTPENPIKVGGKSPKNERRFLNALTGPQGQALSYERAGSCCAFSTPNGLLGRGLLDRYVVRWEGGKKTLILYINMYDYETLKAPVGFNIKK